MNVLKKHPTLCVSIVTYDATILIQIGDRKQTKGGSQMIEVGDWIHIEPVALYCERDQSDATKPTQEQSSRTVLTSNAR